MPSPDFIETFSGVSFRPLSPIVEDIHIRDIAHALAFQCRFSGHTIELYSVAEHCVRVSWLLEDWEVPTKVVLWGLLHDASEAFLVDIPSPLKNSAQFAAYRDAEARLMRAICYRFQLPTQEPRDVRRADLVLLATEARDLMPYRPEHWGALTEEPLPNRITPWYPAEAERKFLRRFEELTEQARAA